MTWPIATSGYEKVFRSRPKPVAVEPVKTQTSKTERVTEKGGKVILKDQQEYGLTVPEGALLSEEEIGMSSLEKIDGLPEGARLVAGVELEPEGLGFVKSAVLTIQLPTGTKTENLVAFAYEEGGKNFYFQPYSGLENGVAEIPVDGFSGGGIIDIPALIPVINPGTPEQTAKQLLADVQRRMGAKMMREIKKGGEGVVDPKLLNEARGILNAWYKEGVRVELNAAEKDDARVDGAVKQMLVWQAQVQLFGLDSNFGKEFEESLTSAAKGVKHGVFQSGKRCVNQKDPKQVAALLRWLRLTQLVGLAGRAGLTEIEIAEKAQKCVVFTIHMDSKVVVPSLGGLKTTAVLDGTLALSDDFTRFEGGGRVEEGPFSYSTGGGGRCQQGAVSYGFSVVDTKFNINWHKKAEAKVELILSLEGVGVEAPMSCTGGVTVNIPAPWGEDYIPGLHQDELIDKEGNEYWIRKWQIVGSKQVYAQKVYKRTIEGVTEETTFILKHTPRE